MNSDAILALISDLYAQVAQLQQENAALRQLLQEQKVDEKTPAHS